MLIAELTTLLTADITPLQSGIALADSALTAFGRKVYVGPSVTSPSLGILAGEIATLKAELSTLRAPNVVTVTANTSAAAAQLTALEAQLSAIRAAAAAPIIPGVGAGGAGRGAGFSASSLQNAGMRNIAGGAIASTIFTAPLALGGAASLKFASDFQKSMLLAVSMTDLGKKNLGSLSQQILALNNDPLLSKAPVAYADGLQIVASKGLNAADSMKVLKAAGYGASAGLGQIKTIGKTVTDVMSAYGESADKAQHITDIMTQAVKFGAGEVTQYAAAFSKVIPLASQLGISFEEVSANIAQATKIGLTPSESVTGLRQALSNIIKPSKAASDAFKELKTSRTELLASLQTKGMAGTFEDLAGRAGGRIEPITAIFGSIRGLTEFLATSGKSTLEDYKKTLDATLHPDGAALEAAKINAQGFSFQLEKLAATAQKAGIEIGTRLLPRLTDFVKVAGQDIPQALDAWDHLPAGVQSLAIKLLGVLALSGPLKSFVGLLQVLGSIPLGIGRFLGLNSLLAGAAGGPIAWALIAAAIAAASVAAGKFYEQMLDASAAAEEARARTSAMADLLEKAANAASSSSGAKKGIDSLASALAGAGDNTAKLLKVLRDATAEKVEIGKDMKLSPIGKAVAETELDHFIANLSNRIITLNVALKPVVDLAQGKDTPDTRAASDDQSFAARARRAGVTVPVKPPETIEVRDANKLWLGTTTVKNTVALSDYWAKLNAATSAIIAFENAHKGAAPVVQSQTKTIHEQAEAVGRLTDAELAREQKRITAEANAGRLRPQINGANNPNFDADAFTRGPKVEAEIARRHQVRQAIADRDKQLAANAAAATAAEQAAQDAETQHREQAALQKSLGEKSQMWNAFGSQVEGVLGRIRQEEEQGGINGEKTAKARVEAELLKRAYDGIPEPLKQSLVQLAGIEFRMQKMLSMRDGFRELFNGIYGGLSAGGRQQFAEFAAQFEKSLGMGKTWADLQGQRNALARPLIGTVEGNISSLKSQQEQVGVANSKVGEVYGGATGGNAKSLFEKYNLQSTVDMTCADVASRTVEALGIHIKKSVSAGGLEKNVKAAGWDRVDPRTAPEGSLVFKYSASARSKTHAMMALGGGQLASSSDHKVSYIDANGNERAYAPPGAGMAPVASGSGVPAIQLRAPRGINLPGNAPFDSRLLTMRDLPKGWGGSMQDYRARPGEETGNRAAFEKYVQSLAAAGKPWQGDYTKARAGMTAADMDVSVQKAHWTALDRARDLSNSTRLNQNGRGDDVSQYLNTAGQDMTPKADRMRILQGLVNDSLAKSVTATRNFNTEQFNTAKVLAAGAPFLKGASSDMAAYERATALAQKRVENWNNLKGARDSIDSLMASARADGLAGNVRGVVAKTGQARALQAQHDADLKALNDGAATTYDANALREAQKGYDSAQVAQRLTNELLQYQLGLLRNKHLSQQQINDDLEVERVRREALKALTDAKDPDAATKADAAAAAKRREQFSNRRIAGLGSFADGRSQIDLLQSQMGIAGRYGVDDPERKIQEQLAEKRFQLTGGKGGPLNSDQHKQFGQFESYLRLQKTSNDLDKANRDIWGMKNSAVDLQVQRESALTFTSRQRLEAELRGEEAKRRIAEQNGQFEDASVKAARQLLDLGRLQSAADEDALNQKKAQAGDIQGLLRSGMGGDFKSPFKMLHDQMTDSLSAGLTNKLFGQNLLDSKPGGLMSLLGLGGREGGMVGTSGYAGPLSPAEYRKRDRAAPLSDYAQLAKTTGRALTTLHAGAVTVHAATITNHAATATTHAQTATVQARTVNMPGGGSTAPLSNFVPLRGSTNGGAGSGQSAEQVGAAIVGSAGAIG